MSMAILRFEADASSVCRGLLQAETHGKAANAVRAAFVADLPVPLYSPQFGHGRWDVSRPCGCRSSKLNAIVQ
jgi:hypothetical protein